MDKATYVKRLKRMLESKGERACTSCPEAPYYSGQHPADVAACEMCQKFVGLKLVNYYSFHKCPCSRPGKLGAIPRAWKKIREYESVHGEV